MTLPSLRKLEEDLGVNKTTLHNWKKSRPKLYSFIMEAYKNKELLRQNLKMMINQKKILENEIELTKNKI